MQNPDELSFVGDYDPSFSFILLNVVGVVSCVCLDSVSIKNYSVSGLPYMGILRFCALVCCMCWTQTLL
jgi:hypothetical protein